MRDMRNSEVNDTEVSTHFAQRTDRHTDYFSTFQTPLPTFFVTLALFFTTLVLVVNTPA